MNKSHCIAFEERGTVRRADKLTKKTRGNRAKSQAALTRWQYVEGSAAVSSALSDWKKKCASSRNHQY